MSRQFRPSRYEHPTEQDPRVFSYLEAIFGAPPQVNDEGADLIMPDGTKIEVKSTKEWQKSTHSRGPRRRGRFCRHGYEDCDYYLFVLVREDKTLDFHLEHSQSVEDRFGFSGTINWALIEQFNQRGAKWGKIESS